MTVLHVRAASQPIGRRRDARATITKLATSQPTSGHQISASLKPGVFGQPVPPLSSGYWKLCVDHVLQADHGADLDFLVGRRGAFVPKDTH